ncbi:Fic family protein [Pseudomonas nunensis]|uniref:Fic family protein n=1 Tax=Pseudomonas nunensis TaxID=2961896 RepID=UPI0025B279F2|nr:Fic family protein [Pseudomonas nunensis]MDN3220274.1 Fic family protein [Pseudomonas nunensis]
MKKPPALRGRSDPVFDLLAQSPHKERLSDYLVLLKPLDGQGRYLPFDDLRHRWAPGLDTHLCWALVKKARTAQYARLLPLGEPIQWGNFVLTPVAQIAISTVDREATTAALAYMNRQIGEQAHFSYLLNDLIEDEAISSSQLEGAATTTRVAKDMLKRKRLPRTPDERMVIGNYKMMNFAWEMRDRPLSVELIAAIHCVGVEGIDDAKYSPGTFRVKDDVVVQDGEGNTVHTPPPAAGLALRLQELAKWINQANNDPFHADYIHPLIKAMALHFALGYEHPFRDGNGRVARALFYWSMFKNDFSAFRYIAISTLLRNAPVKYGRSYLHTEADDLDLTYFIDFQCSVVLRAVTGFTEVYRKSLAYCRSEPVWERACSRRRCVSRYQR